jgi:RNA polymerase sigma-70 factor (ECF subfamily)
MEQPPTTRWSLLLRLRQPRDERAWFEFTAIYTPLIQRLARQKGLQEADACDLTQEVFQAVARALEQELYDPQRGSFRAWLFAVARNLAVNFLASPARRWRGSGDSDVRRLLEEQPAPDAGESAVFDTECRRQLLYWAAEQVRGEFSELTWQAFWQAGVEGKAAADVAAALGTTVGAVYHYKSRVMARLRQKIAQVAGEA